LRGKAGSLTSLEELALKAAQGDRDAFGDIYGTLLDPVFKYLYWNTGSREEAEDLAEEVFTRCLISIKSYNPKRGPFRAWVFRIAHNLVVDYHRRRSRRPQEEIREGVENGSPSAQERLEEKEKASALREILQELPTMQRQVIIMKYFAEMGNREVSMALGRSEGAVNAIQHRALRNLGKKLEERGWRG
jgi:RNA polymerase sigma-70 factor (ECF subfamily)